MSDEKPPKKDPYPQLPRRALFEERPKGGRPSSGEPWVALGITRRTYYRRKKAGEL